MKARSMINYDQHKSLPLLLRHPRPSLALALLRQLLTLRQQHLALELGLGQDLRHRDGLAVEGSDRLIAQLLGLLEAHGDDGLVEEF